MTNRERIKYTSQGLIPGSALKAKPTATNRWLAQQLRMGNHHKVSRKVSVWIRSASGKVG